MTTKPTTLHETKTPPKEDYGDCFVILSRFDQPQLSKTRETITVDKCYNEIVKMHQKLAHKQPALVNKKVLILLNDNARSHVSMITCHKSCTR
ncbi:hypothetical protein TNCT_25741 [Trichonephila clavata]|uniref:Transposase n=1 Tax=Trichonephila clavata TaxID=2740835 RepID=A0A8X6JL38_TRICU|nr:hypothetical protein TNCT_25741 [Trichonephila clavata]